jgi:hypothetical protein
MGLLHFIRLTTRVHTLTLGRHFPIFRSSQDGMTSASKSLVASFTNEVFDKPGGNPIGNNFEISFMLKFHRHRMALGKLFLLLNHLNENWDLIQ